MAACLHPEFKMTWISDENRKKEIKSFIVDEIRSLNEADQSRLGHESSSDNEEISDANKPKNFFNDFRRSRKRNRSGNDEATELVNRFFDVDTGSIESLPQGLQNLFRKLNTPIPSSAAVERLFSLGKEVLKPKQSDLTDDHLEMLVFLRGRIPNSVEQTEDEGQK